MDNKFNSRFFTTNDNQCNKFVFEDILANKNWQSRLYEYPWCAEFTEDGHVSLDAASGICHPFKFYLAQNNNDTYACDLDKRITSKDDIKKDVESHFGKNSFSFVENEIAKINFKKCLLTNTGYEDKKFDRVYCISVLEHMNDLSNKFSFIMKSKFLFNKFKHDIYDALIEFKRILKDDGYIILTFDYPRINLKYFDKILPEVGLTYAGDIDYNIPSSAISYTGYKCFRAVLRKYNKE